MKLGISFLLIAVATIAVAAEESLSGAGAADRLLQLGLLDVTKAPYRADPTGTADSTKAIQRAVNDARDRGLVCFFPEGTYLISDTLSCEQQVQRLDRPRNADGTAQHFWDRSHRIVIFGSTKGRRPVLKLSKVAKGFDDAAKPKVAVWIWAQTRNDAPGKQEPRWGEEQPNISFNHYFKGIDLDIRGHAGAIGIRHAGSQGSALLDSTILAEGAYAGMNNCCGQGGGTYNIEVLGGQYGIVIEPNSRFPILTGCAFKGQTKTAIRYARGGSQVPTLLVGCQIESASDTAVDFTTERGYAGINLVDCLIALKPGGVIARTTKRENLFLENTFVKGAASVHTQGGTLPTTDGWTLIERYSSHTAPGVNLLNGKQTAGEVAECKPIESVPAFVTIRTRHYSGIPSFEDQGVVDVKAFGATGDGETDDTKAFEKAIQASDRVFVPKGSYHLSGTLRLRPNTHLFGLTRTLSSMGGSGSGRGRGRGDEEGNSFSIITADDPQSAPGLSLLSVRGRVDWKSGAGVCFLASAPVTISANGGGRFYGVMAMGRPWVLKGIRHPTSFYALNVERVLSNPQSEIKDCSHLRIYYFKVEAGTISRANAGDGNTPCRIANSQDIRVYCMYGNVKQLGSRPMLDVVDSDQVVVSQLKAFQPGSFPHLTETRGDRNSDIPSSKTCALFVRDTTGGSGND
jgi:hypothetical protein